MTESADAVLLALIATLEQRAKARGEKSVVKGVAARLADAGANPALIAEIEGLRKKKADAPAPAKAPTTVRTQAKARAVADTKPPAKAAKSKPAGPKAKAPEQPAVQG
jgi:hypothetical protein